MLKIGEKIKELRKAQDVTQEKLADYLNISYQAVSKLENGLALPDITLLPKLANFFGVSTDELLDLKASENEAELLQFFKRNVKRFVIGYHNIFHSQHLSSDRCCFLFVNDFLKWIKTVT